MASTPNEILLHDAAVAGDAATTARLIFGGINMYHENIRTGLIVPVFQAMLSDNTNVAMVYINHPEFNLEIKDYIGCGLIHYAAGMYDVTVLRHLLENGVNVNSLSNKNETPLVDAVASNRLENIRLLMEFGADPFIKNINDQNIFDIINDPKYCIKNGNEIIELINSYVGEDVKEPGVL